MKTMLPNASSHPTKIHMISKDVIVVNQNLSRTAHIPTSKLTT